MTIPDSLSLSSTAKPKALISIRDLRTHCSTCSMRELCLPFGLDSEAMQQLDAAITDRTRLKKGDKLYRAGDAFAALYAIRLGSRKTTVLAEDGREQITGYHMPETLSAWTASARDHHGCEAVARGH
jgi:CRP/FNR family transcriptional regulator